MASKNFEISDRKFLIRNSVYLLSNYLNEKQINKIIAISLCILFDFKKNEILKNSTNEKSEHILNTFNELSIWSQKEDIKKTLYYCYSIHNAFKTIVDMSLKDIETNEILKLIKLISSQHRFNGHNIEKWKDFSIINFKDIELLKSNLKIMKIKRRLQDNDIKFIGYDEIMKFKNGVKDNG